MRIEARPAEAVRSVPEGADVAVWVARIVTAVRACVVASVGGLLAVGPPWVRDHAVALLITLTAAVIYALFLVGHPDLEVRRTRYVWYVTLTDTALSLLVIAFTGGPSSPCVSILVLVVVAAAARAPAGEAIAITLGVAGLYTATVAWWSPDQHTGLDPLLLGAWWSLYLILAAVMATALSVAAEREQHSRLLAKVQAEEEHAVAAEERDLRARLLQSYQTQQDGLRVLLHEFRTPLASLQALGDAIADEDRPMSGPDRAATVRLANDHVRHLNDMLDALSDVALSRRPTFSSGRVCDIDMEALIVAAAHAAGLNRPRLSVHVDESAHTVHLDVQALRRVLTNLMENAARHGADQPVDVTCSVENQTLRCSVMDRGPGLPPESLGEVTAKFVSLGDRRGTAGLGLWIVQQIIDATGGRLFFTERDGGGLTATFTMPFSQYTGA